MMNRLFLTFALATLLGACQPTADTRPPLEGARMGGAFSLTNQNGRMVKDSDFAGQYRLVYFGYAHCPDVCPVDLQKLMRGFALVEQQDATLAKRIQPIFITVDPDRDTQPVLKQFVAAFHPRLIGLRGTPEETAAVAKRYAVFFQKTPADAAGSYRIDHNRMTVLYGPKGEPLSTIPEAASPEEIAAAIRQWAK